MSTQNNNSVWNLSSLLEGDKDPSILTKREEVKKLNATFVQKWKDRNDYLEDSLVLREALDDYEKVFRHHGTGTTEGYYFWLRSQQDENNPDIKGKRKKAEEFDKEIFNETHFFTLRIAEVSKEIQKKFLEAHELHAYHHFLERLFATDRHLLSEPEEKIFTLVYDSLYTNWTRMTSGFLTQEEGEVVLKDGAKKVLSFSELLNTTMSRSTSERDQAEKIFTGILKKHVATAEVELNAVLGAKQNEDTLRNFPRPDSSRHLNDDIETKVVDVLLDVISKRNSIATEFYKLKAQLHGVPVLKYHERNVPYGSIDKKYTFEETTTLIRKTFKKLDESFLTIADAYINEGRVDVYPRKGKRSGAFAVHSLLSNPTYLFLNHTDTLNDVLTFAHELGHGINYELMRKKVHALDFDLPLSTAEVASTFMEDFVLEELLVDANDEERLVLMMNKLSDDVKTIFRQVACYRFEQNIHEEYRKSGYLTKEYIGEMFQKHMRAYMGESVEQSKGSENYWVHWSHIRTFFYVYSYANGLLISKFLQQSVKRDPAYIEKVKEFLSAGTSMSPQNIFLALGVDMSDSAFWNSGLDEVEALLEETKMLAKKLGKIEMM